jgi:hypothetical protein
VRLLVNHGGFGEIESSPLTMDRGNGRNGPRTTVRSVSSKSSALCTTPIPLWTSSIACPGKAPQLAQLKAGMPVMSRPTMSAWMLSVPS